ncbi:Fur family transcriptional regulator [Desulfovibrio oxyclinae]|uniref:Fur family transcriptional regulator n=1 Tax=Desulfovibrio oxyclinae TaxID=63560 RepID=UPI000363CB23|nr:transcriptional repressor [Desulfovibrio oxyclinae]
MHTEMNFRLSKQRRVILEELRKVTSHPTADEVYDMVRKILPRISLGTVYRNLEFLNSQGMVLKLGGPGEQKRFDGNPDPHPHIRCEVCSRIADIMCEVSDPVLPEGEEQGFTVHHCNVEFVGVCPECRAACQ